MRTVSAADANRHFSKILRAVTGGETVVVTSRGKPVATMSPVPPDDAEQKQRQKALDHLLARLRSQPAMNLGRFNRDDLYED